MIDALATREESFDRFEEVLPNGTTHTAVRDFDDFFGGSFDEFSVDARRSELIFDDSDAPTFGISDYVIQEGGFPRAEKACEDGYRDHDAGDEGVVLPHCLQCWMSSIVSELRASGGRGV